jgi:hypothetical protein
MTCPSCYSQHTDMATALVCSRKSNPLPTLSRPLGEDANKQPFQPPENAHQGVDSGSPKRPLSPSTNPLTSTTVFRYGRAGKSGRLRVPDVEERRRARERSWQYRDRQRNRGSVRRELVSGLPESAVVPSPGHDTA